MAFDNRLCLLVIGRSDLVLVDLESVHCSIFRVFYDVCSWC